MQLALMLKNLCVIPDDRLLHQKKIFQDPVNLHGKMFYNNKIVPKETEGNIVLKESKSKCFKQED